MTIDDWRDCCLEDVVRLQRGFDLTESERRPGAIPVMGSAGMNGWHDTSRAPGPGVTIGRSGVGSMGIVSYSPVAYWPHNTTLFVTDFLGNDPRFIYYFLKAIDFRRFNSGSAQASLNRNYVAKIRVRIPPTDEQRELGALLGALDDKIDLNRRTRATVEEMADALFKSWFIDFDPVHAKRAGRTPSFTGDHIGVLFPRSITGGIPTGWMPVALDSIAGFLNGLALQRFPAVAAEPSLPVLKIAQLRAGSVMGADQCNTSVPDSHRVWDGDLIFSWSGSLLVRIWTGGLAALNQHLFKVTSDRFPRWFIHGWLRHHLPTFQGIAAGKATTMGHIQRHHLTAANVIVPLVASLAAAGEILAPLEDHGVRCDLESRTLSQLRDLLLPRLLSGELRVRDATCIVEAVA